MIVADYSNMVEFDELMNTRFVGYDGLVNRIRYRLLYEYDSVPYMEGGIRYSVFSRSPDFVQQAKSVVSDLVDDLEVDQQGRVIVSSVGLQVEKG